MSYAMCHVFTTAGMDEDIQKAMAQWMSYRISYKSPDGKKISTVVNDFLKSLGSNVKDSERYDSAVAGLKTVYADADVPGILDETFSDEGADTEWTDWPTRCKNASKTVGEVSARTNAKSRTTPAKPKKKA